MAIPTALGREEVHATHTAPLAIPSIWWGIQLWGSAESQAIPLPSLHVGEKSSFPGCVPPSDMINSKSVVGIKPGDSGVMIGYQVDEFTDTWLVRHFLLSHTITLVLQARCQHSTHFPLELGCEN